MIHLPASLRVYLCLTACDMRNYVPFIVMRSCAVPSADLAGSSRRRTAHNASYFERSIASNLSGGRK